MDLTLDSTKSSQNNENHKISDNLENLNSTNSKDKSLNIDKSREQYSKTPEFKQKTFKKRKSSNTTDDLPVSTVDDLLRELQKKKMKKN